MNDDQRAGPRAGARQRLPADTPPSRPQLAATATPDASAPQAAPQTSRRATGPGWRHTFTSLQNRNYRYLWLGMVVSMGGLQMQMIARGYLAYNITESPIVLGLVNAGFALPMLALSLFGGAAADRMDRKRVIQIGQGLSGILAGFIAITIATGAITWYYLLAVSMVQGAVFAFMMPARQAIIPQLVGRDSLTNALALDAAGMSAATLIAPATAGILYAWLGPDGVYVVVAGMGLAAVLLTTQIPTLDRAHMEGKTPVLADIKAGLVYIRRSPLVMALLVMGLASALFAMPFRYLLPIFVVDVYHAGPKAYGLMVSINGLGSLAGALFIASRGRSRRGLLLIMGTFLSGIGLMLVALVPFFLAGIAFMVLLGLADSARRTLNQALVMEEVEDQYRGRVMSVFMMNFGLMPLGVLPASIVAQFVGGREAVGALAVLLLITASAILATQRRLREMP